MSLSCTRWLAYRSLLAFTGFANLARLVIDHDIMRLDITMHDTFGMAEVEGLKPPV
jgi:hypothetical protein